MAAGRIKGITIEIGANTTPLTKALASVDNAISKTQKNIRDLDKALKLDPGNTNLLKDKQKELAIEIENAKNKLQTEKEAYEQLSRADKTPENIEQMRQLKVQIDLDTVALADLEKQARESASVLGTQMQVAGEKIQEVGSKITAVGDKITGLGQTMTTKVTTPIVAGFGAIIKTTADFDAEMSKVQAISGATASDMDDLTAKAREMGSTTKFSATEAGEAMEYMAMAGWKTEDMLKGVEGIMNLAAASGEELGTTSDIVTDALTAFGMSADQSGRFADILAAAASNANTNVSMMGESFKYVAPVAGSLGYSAEDVAVALGLMANSGIKADMAGTSLRNMFQRMAKPTKESQAAMDRLGLSLADDEGRMYSFREIMDQLRVSFKDINMSAEEYDKQLDLLQTALENGNLTQKKYDAELEELNKQAFGAEGAEKARAAAMLGGTRAMSGLLAIANASTEDYNQLTAAIDGSSDAMAKLADGSVVPLNEALASGQEVIEQYNGAAEAMANTMQDNLTGDLTILKSDLQELAISMGTLIMPLLREAVERIKGVVDWLNSLDDSTKMTIMKVAAIAAAIGPVLMVVGTLVSSFGKLTSAFGSVVSAGGKLMTFFAGISAPIAIIVAAIGALAAAFVYLYNTNDEFAASVNEKWGQIKESFSAMMEKIQPALEDLGKAFGDLMTALEPVFEFIMTGIMGIINGVIAAAEPIISAVKNVIDFVTNIVNAFVALFSGDFDGFLEYLKKALNAALEFFGNIIKAKIEFIKGFFKAFGVDAAAIFNGIKDKVTETFTKLVAAVKSKITEVPAVVKTKLGEAMDFIKGLPGQALEWGKDLIQNLIDGILSKVHAVGDAIGSIADVIAGFIHFSLPEEGPLAKANTFMPDFIKLLTTGLENGIPQLETAMGDVASALVPGAASMQAGSSRSVATYNTPVNITVYGAEGQDVRELADIIQNRINNAVYQQGAVFA